MHTAFPTLRLGVLQSLRDLKQAYASDDKLFEHNDCPYDFETVSVLKEILDVSVRVEVVEKLVHAEVSRDARGGLTDDDIGIVEDELRLCLDELRNINKEREGVSRMDDETLLKIIKAKATLVEQIVKLRERVMNVRRQSAFEATIISLLEDLVSEDDRTEFLRRLAPYREA